MNDINTQDPLLAPRIECENIPLPLPLNMASSGQEVLDMNQALLELPPFESPSNPTRNPNVIVEPQPDIYLTNMSASPWSFTTEDNFNFPYCEQ